MCNIIDDLHALIETSWNWYLEKILAIELVNIYIYDENLLSEIYICKNSITYVIYIIP